MRRGLPLLRGIAVTLAAAVTATAQPRPNGPYLASPLSLSYGYDNNFASNGQELSDKVAIVTSPWLSWKKSTHRSRFSVDYQPEFEIFSSHGNLNAWNHSALLRFSYQLSGRTTIEAGESFLSTIDPTRKLDNSLLLLPLGLYQQNAVYAQLSYRRSGRTKYSFRLDNVVTKTSLVGDIAGRLNQISAGAAASVEHTIDAHHSVNVNAGQLWVRPFDTLLYGNTTGVQIVNAGYDYTPTPDIAIRFTGGLVRSKPTAFTGGVSLEKKFGAVWFAAAYKRYLNFFGGLGQPAAAPLGTAFAPGLAPNAIYQVASLRAWGNITKNLTIEANGQRARIGLNRENRPIQGLVGQLRLDRKITNRAGLFVISEYYGQNVNDFAGLPMARSRYFGGVNVSLLRPPVTETKPKRRRPPVDDPKKAGEGSPEER